mmetsp:Transcript_1141/g.1040  ORF Transcript_1141/g.1040 Transcript_1141/m.1040 type:complete len:110 (+) Transcript_1141:1323-1652(+)
MDVSYIKQTRFEKIFNIRLTKNLIKVMALFCSNSHSSFQKLFYNQLPHPYLKVSTNIIKEMSHFIIDLHLIDTTIFAELQLLPLINNSIDMLTQSCQGPNHEIQSILAN